MDSKPVYWQEFCFRRGDRFWSGYFAVRDFNNFIDFNFSREKFKEASASDDPDGAHRGFELGDNGASFSRSLAILAAICAF